MGWIPTGEARLCRNCRMIGYMDDFPPVEFASVPPKSPTIPATTFKKLFAGQAFEVQCSQVFNNGNLDLKWTRGLAITCAYEGLWTPNGPVTPEDIRHMQTRVVQFNALTPITGELQAVPLCPETFCMWVSMSSALFAARMHRDPGLPNAEDAEEADLEEAIWM